MRIRNSLVVVLALALGAVAVDVVQAMPERDVVAQLRADTGRYHALNRALADGYAQFLDCVSEPGEGAMGTHFVNGELVGDSELDPARPEALLYETSSNGQMTLLGVEFIVFAEAWDAEHTELPSLFDQEFHYVPEGNRYGIPAFYELHVWAWRENPAGLFEDWNPDVQCP